MLPLLGTLIGSAAPLLASFFSSDKQPVVQAGVRFAATALGCAPTEESVRAALDLDPEAFVKLREFESVERIRMAEEKTKLEAIHAGDRQDARSFALDSGQADKLFFLSVYLMTIAMGLEAAVLFVDTANVSEALVGRVLGTFDTLAVMTTTFWFGSSLGSGSKDALLYNSTPAR